VLHLLGHDKQEQRDHEDSCMDPLPSDGILLEELIILINRHCRCSVSEGLCKASYLGYTLFVWATDIRQELTLACDFMLHIDRRVGIVR
jgi:hypothetical protein